jgi:MtN3 and saliva related transmembrane protein
MPLISFDDNCFGRGLNLSGAIRLRIERRRFIPVEVMTSLVYSIGLLAAALTSLSYLPQVQKAFPRGATKDLSFKTLAVLATGLGLWVVYGLLKGDSVIVTANVVGLSLVGVLLAFKLRDTGWMQRS